MEVPSGNAAWGFDPTSIGSCVLWLDAADSDTITGSPATAWRDKSPNKTDVSATAGPTVSGNTYNGKSALAFDGCTNYFTTNLQIWGDGHCLIAAYRPNSITGTSTNNTRVFSFNSNTGSNIIFPTRAANTSRGYVNTFGGTGVGTLDSNNSTMVENAVAGTMNLIVANCASGLIYVRKNGTAQSRSTRYLLRNALSPVLTIGCWYSNATPLQFFWGDIAELLVYSNTLSLNQLQAVEGYLGKKWGVQSAFSNLHTYKSVIPVARGFTPLDISGCLTWLDSSDMATMTFSGSNITTWVDKSPSQNDFTLYQGSRGPLLAVDPSSGLSGVYLDASGAILCQQRGISHTSNMYFMVVRASAWGTGGTASSIISYPGEGAVRTLGATTKYPYWDISLANSGLVNSTSYQTVIWKDGSGYFVPSTTTQQLPIFSNQLWSFRFTYATVSVDCLGAFSNGNLIKSDREGFFGYIHELLRYDRWLNDADRLSIEKYLGDKWGHTNAMPSNVANWDPTATPTSPLDISGCFLWLDGADPSAIVIGSTTDVSSWKDKSGYTNDVIQPTVSNRPTVLNAGQNGNQVLSFTGPGVFQTTTSQYLYNSSVIFPGSNYTIFAIAYGNNNCNSSYTKYNYLLKPGYTNPYIGFFGSVSNNYATFDGSTNDWNDIASNTPAKSIDARWSVLTLVHDGSINPVLDSSAQDVKYAPSVNTSGIIIGEAPAGYTGQCWNGYIGEIIVYRRALVAEERQRMEAYLGQKWGVYSNLWSNNVFRYIK